MCVCMFEIHAHIPCVFASIEHQRNKYNRFLRFGEAKLVTLYQAIYLVSDCIHFILSRSSGHLRKSQPQLCYNCRFATFEKIVTGFPLLFHICRGLYKNNPFRRLRLWRAFLRHAGLFKATGPRASVPLLIRQTSGRHDDFRHDLALTPRPHVDGWLVVAGAIVTWATGRLFTRRVFVLVRVHTRLLVRHTSRRHLHFLFRFLLFRTSVHAGLLALDRRDRLVNLWHCQLWHCERTKEQAKD